MGVYKGDIEKALSQLNDINLWWSTFLEQYSYTNVTNRNIRKINKHLRKYQVK